MYNFFKEWYNERPNGMTRGIKIFEMTWIILIVLMLLSIPFLAK